MATFMGALEGLQFPMSRWMHFPAALQGSLLVSDQCSTLSHLWLSSLWPCWWLRKAESRAPSPLFICQHSVLWQHTHLVCPVRSIDPLPLPQTLQPASHPSGIFNWHAPNAFNLWWTWRVTKAELGFDLLVCECCRVLLYFTLAYNISLLWFECVLQSLYAGNFNPKFIHWWHLQMRPLKGNYS
jgi:hypothetical protein